MNLPDTEKKRSFIISVLFLVVVYYVIAFLYKVALPFSMPFLIAWLVAMLAEPLIRLLSKLRIRRGLASIVSLLAVFSIFAWISIVVVSRIAYEAAALKDLMPAISQFVVDLINTTADAIERLFSLLPAYVADYVEQTAAGMIEGLPTAIGSLTMPLITNVTSLAAGLPNMLVMALITLTACILLSMDFPRVRAFLDRQIPERAQGMVLEAKQFFKLTIGRLLRSYVIIISITFVELYIGFMLMRLDYAVTLAALICVVDILPILGCGTVLVPWSVIAFLMGNFQQGIFIAVLYLIITAVRQVIEPKIVGDNIGLHPLLALISFYLGLKTMGVLGMFIMPVVFIMIKHLQDEGYIRLFAPLEPAPVPTAEAEEPPPEQ